MPLGVIEFKQPTRCRAPRTGVCLIYIDAVSIRQDKTRTSMRKIGTLQIRCYHGGANEIANAGAEVRVLYEGEELSTRVLGRQEHNRGMAKGVVLHHA